LRCSSGELGRRVEALFEVDVAEVGFADHLRRADYGGRASEDLPTKVDDVDVLAQAHDQRHVVLHEQDADASLVDDAL
jgi:hypothetical protein